MDKTKTEIGKDVIESLTLGMYEDSRFIYREYIQNSADQIDKAVEENILQSLHDAKIEIDIDYTSKTISILDNATGIESNQVQPILKNIAQSTKDRSKNKGFRGIGRLGGLAYCDKLTFETSFKGENVKSYLIWDAQKLKAIINNRATKEEATAVIDEVTFFSTDKEESTNLHYFKVTLEGVSNKDLLDKKIIYQYLSMVAPAPYSKGFIFKKKIDDKAKELKFSIDEYSIFVNNDQIFKAYTASIYEGDNNDKKKIDEVYDIDIYEIRNSKNKSLAWGWYSISSLIKQMPPINSARSIRLRKGNIQIGMEDTLAKLFKDARWSRYYFGEIHITTPNLIPNSRRDYFLESTDLDDFEKLVRIKFIELEKLNYLSSNLRSNQKKKEDFKASVNEYNEKLTKRGFTDGEEKAYLEKKIEVKKEKAQLAEKELAKAKAKSANNFAQQKVFEKVMGKNEPQVDKVIINEENGKTKYMTDDLFKLNRKDRKLVSQILAVIDSVLMKDLAENLKRKIIEELNK